MNMIGIDYLFLLTSGKIIFMQRLRVAATAKKEIFDAFLPLIKLFKQK